MSVPFVTKTERMPILVGLHFSVRASKRKNPNEFSKPNFEPESNPDSGPFTAIVSRQQMPVAEKEVSAVKSAGSERWKALAVLWVVFG